MSTQEFYDELMSQNILIAEFWGYKFYPSDPWYKLNGYRDHYWIDNKDKSIQRLVPKNFRFDWDWNWLLPVIKKIDKMDFLDAPHNHELIRYHAEFCVNIKEKIIEEDIQEAYDMVVDFINIYNKNKK